MGSCGTCRYTFVKGLLCTEDLEKEFLEALNAKAFAEAVRYNGHDMPDFNAAILFSGNKEMLSYSQIVDLSNPDKDYRPFEKEDGRKLVDFESCSGTMNGSLDDLVDQPKLQGITAMALLIDLAKAKTGDNSHIVMMTNDSYKGCCA